MAKKLAIPPGWRTLEEMLAEIDWERAAAEYRGDSPLLSRSKGWRRNWTILRERCARGELDSRCLINGEMKEVSREWWENWDGIIKHRKWDGVFRKTRRSCRSPTGLLLRTICRRGP